MSQSQVVYKGKFIVEIEVLASESPFGVHVADQKDIRCSVTPIIETEGEFDRSDSYKDSFFRYGIEYLKEHLQSAVTSLVKQMAFMEWYVAPGSKNRWNLDYKQTNIILKAIHRFQNKETEKRIGSVRQGNPHEDSKGYLRQRLRSTKKVWLNGQDHSKKAFYEIFSGKSRVEYGFPSDSALYKQLNRWIDKAGFPDDFLE